MVAMVTMVTKGPAAFVPGYHPEMETLDPQYQHIKDSAIRSSGPTNL